MSQQRNLALYMTGPNAAGKTTVLAVIAKALEEAGVREIVFVKPEMPEAMIREKAGVIDNINHEVRIELHELFGDVSLTTKGAQNAQMDLLNRCVDFLSSNSVNDSVLRNLLVNDLQKVTGKRT